MKASRQVAPAQVGGCTPLVAVTGSQPPYIFDLPHILSLPAGFECRFRYRHRWVADEVLHLLKSARESLVGQPLIVLFHSQEARRLLPLRRCTVIGLENLGPVVLLRFTVGSFVKVSTDVVGSPRRDSARRDESHRLDDVGKSLLSIKDYDLSQPLQEQQYFRCVHEMPEGLRWAETEMADIEGISADWARLAALLMGEKNLSRIPMFHLLGFRKKDGGVVAPAPMGGKYTVSEQETKGFKLREGYRYRLRLLEWCESVDDLSPAATVTVNVLPEVLALEGASNLVVGKYDVLEFAFAARKPGYSELAIRLEPMSPHNQGAGSGPADAGASEPSVLPRRDGWPVVYSARVPIQVCHNWWRLGRLALVGAIGFCLYIWHQPVTVFGWQIKSPGALGEVAGLLMLFTALGEYLQRFAKFSSDVRGFAAGLAPERPK